mgnify:CR=1 FL=1
MNNSNKNIINEFLDYLKTIRKYSEHTLRSYRFDLEEFNLFCSNYDSISNFLEINSQTIQSFLQTLYRKKLSSKTQARRLASIKSMYKYLVETKSIETNIALVIKTPKMIKELPHFLSLKEASDILCLPVGRDMKAYRERTILQLFYATGVRISEMIKIKLDDIKMEEGIINVVGKRNKKRFVIIGPEASKTLKKYILERSKNKVYDNHSYLFPPINARTKNFEKKYIHQNTIFNIVKKYMNIVSNDKKLSPHSLRHTFATHMLNNGADLMAIKDLLGHESLASTQIYTHVQLKKIKATYDQTHPHAK